jgi:acetoacetyl-CoA synthetase
MSQAIWTPSPERVARAHLSRFLGEVGEQHPEVVDYPALFRFSIDHAAEFWRRVWDFCEVRAEQRGERVVDDLGRMPGARFFPEARLNFAENLLRYRDERPAIVAWNELGPRRRLTYAELAAEVARVADGLRGLGIGPGDRVAGFLPNLPEAIVAMLATASLGAVWSSCSPDFGVKGILDRFGQIQPRVLFCADGYLFAGKRFDCLARAREARAAIPSIEQVVVVPYLEAEPALDGELRYDAFGREGAALEFHAAPFDHPLYVLYSSGTTGLPKCMVHGAGGTLLQHLKELVLHTDLRREDRIFYFTTCGWMMWNWLVSSLAVGATVLLYDGSPFKPSPDILFELAEREGMTIFGTSAKYLALAEKEGVRPLADGRDLSRLRTVLSTGSPLLPESYDYVYREIGADLQLSSISGGTDIVSCFALGNPIAPVYRGELQTRGLGMKVEVFDESGRPVVGEKGELVCTQAFPSMPIGFWNDADGAKYRAAYFDVYPNVWRHGDWAELTERGGLIIYGRSDATLNPGGVRIGTAEIYRQVEQIDEVVESLVIGQDWQDDVRIVLFVRLRDGVSLDDGLRERIRQAIRANASPHHVPKKIVQVADLPRTLSGKLTELAVRDVVHGRPVKNTDAMANPQALELFRDLPALTSC